jgi:hypothetical protein
MPQSHQPPADELLAEELQPYLTDDGWIHSPLLIARKPPCRSTEINQVFAHKKKEAAKLWRQRKYLSYLLLYERGCRFDELEKILALEGQLTDQEAAELVRETWIDSENIHQNRLKWRRVWQSLKDPRLTMNPDEIVGLAAQPDPLLVFRGVQNSRHDKLGLSWTTDREKAVWFAQRFPHRTDSRVLISGYVAKKNIFAYFVHPQESEVVVLPKFVRNRNEEQI